MVCGEGCAGRGRNRLLRSCDDDSCIVERSNSEYARSDILDMVYPLDFSS